LRIGRLFVCIDFIIIIIIILLAQNQIKYKRNLDKIQVCRTIRQAGALTTALKSNKMNYNHAKQT